MLAWVEGCVEGFDKVFRTDTGQNHKVVSLARVNFKRLFHRQRLRYTHQQSTEPTGVSSRVHNHNSLSEPDFFVFRLLAGSEGSEFHRSLEFSP